ncbi:hypothetical protein ACP275_08G185600 [Erythranthe tilingii]
MADDDQFHLGIGNWWDTSSRHRFDGGGGTTPASNIPTTLNALATFGWPLETAAAASAAAGGAAVNRELHMMGLGRLSSQSVDWGQSLLGEESMAAESCEEQWRQKVYSGGVSPEEYSSVHDFKQMNNRGFSLDQSQFSSSQASSNDSTITSQNNMNSGFQAAADSAAAAYGLLLPAENQHSAFQNRSVNCPYSSSGYGGGGTSLSNKYPQFLRKPSTPQPPPPPPPESSSSHLHFTNNTPFWNASSVTTTAAAMTDTYHARSSFFPPPLQTQMSAAPSFDEKPKIGLTTKKNNTETSNKRPRSETPSSSPAFKVRKEKMGDRITALQQLVSPFGKTDTASVLSEATECIKYLHGQLSVLSSPYMESEPPIQHQQSFDKSNDREQQRQDLRSRGLCLVPISNTYPVTDHETSCAGDFWTPTFGATFR